MGGAVAGPESHLLIALHLVSPNKHPELRVRDPLAALQHACHCHKVLYHRQLVAMDGPLPSIALQSPTWPIRYMNSLDKTAVDAGAGSFRGAAVDSHQRPARLTTESAGQVLVL